MEPIHPYHLILLCIAIWRLSGLLSKEHGPYRILDVLRYYTGCRYNMELDSTSPGEYEEPLPGSLCEWTLCIKCHSIFFGLLFYVAYLYSPSLTLVFLSPLWISGCCILIHEVVQVLNGIEQYTKKEK